MRKALAALALAVAVAAGAGSSAHAIEEDDPQWDCRTQGNHLCGTWIEGTHYIAVFDETGAPVGLRIATFPPR